MCFMLRDLQSGLQSEDIDAAWEVTNELPTEVEVAVEEVSEADFNILQHSFFSASSELHLEELDEVADADWQNSLHLGVEWSGVEEEGTVENMLQNNENALQTLNNMIEMCGFEKVDRNIWMEMELEEKKNMFLDIYERKEREMEQGSYTWIHGLIWNILGYLNEFDEWVRLIKS
jgi:hypothetical protein